MGRYVYHSSLYVRLCSLTSLYVRISSEGLWVVFLIKYGYFDHLGKLSPIIYGPHRLGWLSRVFSMLQWSHNCTKLVITQRSGKTHGGVNSYQPQFSAVFWWLFISFSYTGYSLYPIRPYPNLKSHPDINKIARKRHFQVNQGVVVCINRLKNR